MNPKTPQDLDPKLKEAYDRVMGGNFSPSKPTPPNPVPKMETAPAAPVTGPTPPPPPFPMPPANTQPPLSAMSPSTAPATAQPGAPLKKKHKISPMIFLVIGLAFFAVYAVVWGKVFNLF